MVIMASGIARGRVRTTTESRNMAAKHQIQASRDLQPWFTVYLFDIGYPCYAQLTPVKSRYPLTSITCPYRGLKFRAHQGFLEVDRWFFVLLAGSCRVNLLKTGVVKQRINSEV